jgi:tRNA threonylcarbamoyladenosine biosynthesis protein TsaB
VTWHAGRNHTAELYPAIEEVLRRGKTSREDLTGIIVAVGPGSFTGIRIGMATAKGLAIGLRVPLVGVGTLEAATYAFAWGKTLVWGALDAGRGQVVAAAFEDGQNESARGQWRRIVDERIFDPEEFCSAIGDGEVILCGEPPDGVLDLVRERLGDHVMIPSEAARIRRPGALAELGWKRLIDGDTDDPMTLVPFYARPPAALEKNR